MSRYYRRRYTRVVKPKKKWSSNIVVWERQIVASPFIVYLARNSVQTGTPTPSILKVGNFKVSTDVTAHYNTSQGPVNLVANCFIMFVPEGIADADIPSLVGSHPEYIMATKVCGSSVATGSDLSLDTLNMSTRLKRNLNSGDKVVLLIAFSGASTPGEMRLYGTVRYWCCTN